MSLEIRRIVHLNIEGEKFSPQKSRLERAINYLDNSQLRELTTNELNIVSEKFTKRLRENIRKPGNPYVIDTAIDASKTKSLQPGRRAWIFEMGGSHFYGAETIITNDDAPSIDDANGDKPRQIQAGIDTRQFVNSEEYFRTMIKNLDPLFSQAKKPDAIGIVYSFPGQPIARQYGIDVVSQEKLTKQFVIPGISQTPIGQAFINELLNWYDIPKIKIAVLNDGPSVLLSGQDSRIGVIVGTGANIAVSVNEKIYNTTLGSFMDVPVYPIFEIMDKKTDSTGIYFAQKQIGGMYLGMLFTEAARELSRLGLISSQVTTDMPAAIMTDIINGETQQANCFFSQPLDSESIDVLRETALRLCKRSAQLIGTMIGATINAFPYNFKTYEKIPIEGSVFWKMPGYKEIAENAARRIISNNTNIEFVKNNHAGVLGATVAAISLINP